jgi:ABC-2 type transport system permease protein
MSSPARAVLRSETRLFLREPGALFWIMAFPVLLLVILGSIPSFREPSADLGGQRVVDLYVPVTILLAAIMSSIQAMPAVLSAYREQQVLRRIATTPAEPWHLLAAQYALHGGAVVVGAGAVLVVGRLAFDVRIPGSAGAYLLVLALALVALLAAGGLLSSLARTSKASAALSTVVAFPMMFTAGVWLPVQTMPGTLRDIVEATPLGAAAAALGQAGLGSWPDLVHIVVLLGWTLALGALAARYFRWE